MGDNIWLEDRNGVRTPMQWNNSENAGFSEASVDKLYAPVISDETYGYQNVNVEAQMADPHSLFNQIRHMISVRKQYPAFGLADFQWADVGTKAVAVYQRNYHEDNFLILNNLSEQPVDIQLPENSEGFLDILDGQTYHAPTLHLGAYQYLWLRKQ